MQDSIVAPQVKRRRTDQAQILSLVKKFNSQDKLSVAKFCRKHKIHRTTFYAWQKRHSKNVEAPGVKGFVSVEVTPSVSPAKFSEEATLFAEVNGIRLFHYVSPDY